MYLLFDIGVCFGNIDVFRLSNDFNAVILFVKNLKNRRKC